jgi:antitoxin component YwqK of YwqJK toxin-antitoxin module
MCVIVVYQKNNTMTHPLKITLFTLGFAISIIACKKDNETNTLLPPGKPTPPVKTEQCRTTKVTQQIGGITNAITTYEYNNLKQLTKCITDFSGKINESRFSVNAEGLVTRIEDWDNNKLQLAYVFEYENGKIKTEKQIDESGEVLTTYRFEYVGGKLHKKTMYSVITPGGEEVESSYTLYESDNKGQITKTMSYVPKMDQLNGEYTLIATVNYEYDTAKATLAYNHFHFRDVEHFYQPYMIKNIRVTTYVGGDENTSDFILLNSDINARGYALITNASSPQTGYNGKYIYEYACD